MISFIAININQYTEEWNASHVVRKNTKPEVMLRAGRIIEPIKLPKQTSSEHNRKMKK